jgi:N6-L-threonylcarbamoyladenine synthase
MYILGIETSCDETAASIIEIDEKDGSIKPLSNVISSQIALHAKWGGVVPNLAAREHLKNILPVVEASLTLAKLTQADLDLIAVTHGPGLIPALLIGTNTAKAISYAWQKPLLGIHHIEGHIYANFVSNNFKFQSASWRTNFKFPILCLVVSGGHTQLVLMQKHLDYTIIGETQDDAAGEAFDKVARILKLSYPGGPEIARLAKKFNSEESKYFIKFPRPMLNKKNFNFSFSGLKTAVLYLVKKNETLLQDEKFVAEVAYEFQQAVVDVLIAKTLAAAKIYQPKMILLAGGVSANKELQAQLGRKITNDFPNTEFSFPEIDFQLDNAAMIATAAFFRWKNQPADNKIMFSNWKNLKTAANLELK